MVTEQQMIKEASSIYKVMCGSHGEKKIQLDCFQSNHLLVHKTCNVYGNYL